MVAQVVKQLTTNLKVRGSNPAVFYYFPTKITLMLFPAYEWNTSVFAQAALFK